MTDTSQKFLNLLEHRKYDELRQALKAFSVNRHLKDQLSQAFDVTRISQITDVAIRCYIALLLETTHSRDECAAELRNLLLSVFPYDHKETFSALHISGLTFVLNESILVKFLQKELSNPDRSQQYISDCLALCDLSSASVSSLFLDANSAPIVDALLPQWTYEDVAKFLLSHAILAVRHVTFLADIVPFLSSEHVTKLERLLNPFALTPSHCGLGAAKTLASSSSLPTASSQPATVDLDIEAARKHLLQVFLFALVSNKSVKTASSSKPPDVVGEGVRLMRSSRVLATGETHTAIATADTVTIWGNIKRVPRPDAGSAPTLPQVVVIPHILPVSVVAVACGIQHTLAVTNVGVYGWGDSTYGQVGVALPCDGQVGVAKRYATPELLTALAAQQVVTVACGYYHSLALTSDFRVFAWGWGVHGQLGNDRIDDIVTPEPMLQPKEVKVVDIAAGYAHTVVCTTEGEVWTCGSGCFGQLGLDDTSKRSRLTKITTFKEPVKAVASKLSHSLAVTTGGRVYTWGSSPLVLQQAMSAGRRLGGRQASNSALDYLHPTLVDTSAVRGSVSSVACGASMNALLTAEGQLFTWGKNYSNQLGFKDITEKKKPSHVTYLTNSPPLTLASIGQNYVVVCDVQGNLCGWGSNEHSQLGLVNQHVVPSIFHSDESFIPLPRRLCALSTKVKDILGLGMPMPPRWSVTAKSDAESVLDWANGEVRPSLQTLMRVVAGFPKLIDVSCVIQMAVDNKAWCAAAVLCSLAKQRQTALHYHLRWHSLSSLTVADTLVSVVEFHIMLLIKYRNSNKMDNATFEAELVKLCNEAIFFWCEHSLNSDVLEQMVLSMKESLALPFLAALVRHRHPPATKDAARCCPVFALSRTFLAVISAMVLEKHKARLQAAADGDPYADVSGEDLLQLIGSDCPVLS